MPDISMCPTVCEWRETCRRSEKSGTVPDDRRQSWMVWEPDPHTGECAGYWPIRPDARLASPSTPDSP